MRTIHKYALRISDEQVLSVPAGARLLHVADQRGTLCAWFEVDTEAAAVSVPVYVAGTGHDLARLPPGTVHAGSAALHDGALIWHVYVPGWFVA